MKAVFYDRFGGPEVLRVEEVPPPRCHPRGVLFKAEAIAIEGGDLLDRSGEFAPLQDRPLVLGRQAAGVVVEVGAEVDGFHAGDRVVGVRPNGSNAEYVCTPAVTTWRVPEGLSLDHAAAIPIAFATAHDALSHYARLQPGEAVLVCGGSGAVGLAAIQIARMLGAREIVATASERSKFAVLVDRGPHRQIDSHAFASDPRSASGDAVFPVIIDLVGGSSLEAALAVAARGARIVAVGRAARMPFASDLRDLYGKGCTLAGFKLDIASARIRDAVTLMLAGCARGELTVHIDRQFPLADVQAAHAYVEARLATGRVLLRP